VTAKKKVEIVLRQREQLLHDKVQKCYEEKRYETGVGLADDLLKVHPTHADTLAYKALLLLQLKRMNEAYACVKQGLAASIKNSMCWHVYGLLYKADCLYADAIKCYQRAIGFDKDNMNIYRELATAQIQDRDVDGFCETRRQILSLNARSAQQNTNWLSYAISNQLGRYWGALRTRSNCILPPYTTKQV
jgi:peptide alpha-N-acetyltransferase